MARLPAMRTTSEVFGILQQRDREVGVYSTIRAALTMKRRIRACRDWQQQRVDLVVRSKTLLSPDSGWKFGAETDCEQCGFYFLT
jgi:hypothetical protein